MFSRWKFLFRFSRNFSFSSMSPSVQRSINQLSFVVVCIGVWTAASNLEWLDEKIEKSSKFLNINWHAGINVETMETTFMWYCVRCCCCCCRSCCLIIIYQLLLRLLITSDFKSDLFSAVAILICVCTVGEIICIITHTHSHKLPTASMENCLYIINCSPDPTNTVCRTTVTIFYDTVLMLTCLCRACCCVMMFSTCRQTFSNRARYRKITARLWLQMSVIYFHLNNSHKFNLPC